MRRTDGNGRSGAESQALPADGSRTAKPSVPLLAGLAAGERAIRKCSPQPDCPGRISVCVSSMERLELHVLPEPALAPGLCAELACRPKPLPASAFPVWSGWNAFRLFRQGLSRFPPASDLLAFLSPFLWKRCRTLSVSRAVSFNGTPSYFLKMLECSRRQP